MLLLKKRAKRTPFLFLSLSFSSTKLRPTNQNPPIFAPSHLQSYTSAIPPSKTHLYSSFFCTLIHLYLACGRFLSASDAFFSMRNHGLVPLLPLWNRLLYQFNASGFVSQVGHSAFEDQGNGSPNDFRNLSKDIFDNDLQWPVKGGSGVPPGTRPESRKRCKGSGMTFKQTGPIRMHTTCSNCGRNSKTFLEQLLESGRTIQKEHF